MRLNKTVLGWQSVNDMTGINAGQELTRKPIVAGSEVKELLSDSMGNHLIQFPKDLVPGDEALFCWVPSNILEMQKV